MNSNNQPTILGYAKKPKRVEPFVQSAGGRMASQEEILNNTTLPMAVSGITKNIVPSIAQQRGLDWYYIDTGYFGNGEEKTWFRITKNNYQNVGPVVSRPADRLDRFRLDRTQYKRGQKILIVPPDPKISQGYRLESPDQWIDNISSQIRQYTDRTIDIRFRPPSRNVRVLVDTFANALKKDVWAVVIWASNAGVESLIHGIPVVSLGPSACTPLSGTLEKIDSLPNLNQDQVDSWLKHLAYSQFSRREISNGTAWRILNS
jgi:hypothetical protein